MIAETVLHCQDVAVRMPPATTRLLTRSGGLFISNALECFTVIHILRYTSSSTRRATISGQAVLKELVLEDVDVNETDEELWDWIVTNALLKNGIPVTPWMKYTLVRDGNRATVQIDIPIPEGPNDPVVS